MVRARFFGLVAALLVLASCGEPAPSSDGLLRIDFYTDWKAQAEHGGFYQALATGLYADRGLNVVIHPGGPQVDNPRLMAAGAIDMALASNSFQPLNLIAAGAGVKVVMAAFQKDPQVLMTHPDDPMSDFTALRGKSILLADSALHTIWPWLRSRYNLDDSQIRKYTYSLAPWLANPGTVQEGYVSSEPFTAERAGVKPHVYLLADHGYSGYAAMVMVSDKMLRENNTAVRAFVEASAAGWADYLYGDAAPGNALIQADNPEMTDELIAYGIAVMRDNGIVRSGDALTLGIGAMTHDRWEQFFTDMAALGIFDEDLDYRAAYTLEFTGEPAGETP